MEQCLETAKYKVGDKVKIINKLALHGQIATITAAYTDERGDLCYRLDISNSRYGFMDDELAPWTKLHEALY